MLLIFAGWFAAITGGMWLGIAIIKRKKEAMLITAVLIIASVILLYLGMIQ